ncbi:biotin-dependent carboxyltransferase family protein [Alcaligenaceae bacterium A4P071]|nr:biotin-dependent carboxyltransferase family protein [Alcaligenaceae bacterium A4P071]
MGVMRVIKPGPLSTLQDLGRTGHQQFGVPVNGVMDNDAHRRANALVGNAPDVATLECTLQGPVLRFDRDTLIALTGGDLDARVDDISVPRDCAVLLRAGVTLHFGARRTGARAYLAVSGGFDVPTVMGSRSTFVRAGYGGFEGRALQRDDRVPTGAPAVPYRGLLRLMVQAGVPFAAAPVVPWPMPDETPTDNAARPATDGTPETAAAGAAANAAGNATASATASATTDVTASATTDAAPAAASGASAVEKKKIAEPAVDGADQPDAEGTGSRTLRVVAGPQWEAFSATSHTAFVELGYKIDSRSDRMGYRLSGEPLALSAPLEMISEGTPFGTVQVPPDGQPIVLMADRQTAGGYPKIAYVASVDLPQLAQAMPEDVVRFHLVSLGRAQHLAQQRAADLARFAAAAAATLESIAH